MRRAVEHDAALLQRHDTIGEFHGEVNLVQVSQARHAQLVGRPTQVLHHRARRLRVEAGDGLVGQHEQRVLHERPGDAYALLLSAGQLVGARVREVGQTHLVENLERTALLVLAEQTQHAGDGGLVAQAPLQHVLDGGGTVHQVVVLEHHGDAATRLAQRPSAHVRHVVAVEDDAALRGVD